MVNEDLLYKILWAVAGIVIILISIRMFTSPKRLAKELATKEKGK